MKSSKQKQKLYNKFLKLRTKENEVTYKPYKNLFEAIRKKSKRTYYSELLKNIKNDIKNTWKFIKEITSNTKNKRKDLPEKSVINNTTVIKKQEIALQKIAYQTLAPTFHLKYLKNKEVLKKNLPMTPH